MRSISVLIVLCAAAPAFAATNLLTNATFEAGNLNGWNNSSSAASNADKHEGAWSARITTGRITQMFPTASGQTYKVTAWVRIAAETGTDWGGFQAAATTNQDWVHLTEIPGVTQAGYGSQWFKLAFSFKATGSTSGVKFAYFGGAGRSMTVYVDDVQVFLKGANQPPVFTATLTPSPIAAGGTQTFSVSGDDPDGAITNVDWNFGDGTNAQGFTGSHRAALPGTFTATIRAGDDDGAISTQTLMWTCTGSGPTIALSSPVDGATVSTATVSVSGTATNANSVRMSSDRQQSLLATGTANWSATLPLAPGWNRILAQAQDANGKIATVERRVRYVPAGALAISNMAESATNVERWEAFEISFSIENSAATHPQFPYDAVLPAGLAHLDGCSAEVLFSRDNWATTLRRPAFLFQRYTRQRKGGHEWQYPNGAAVWCARFAPPDIGAWKYRIEILEAKGSAQSAERSFTCVTQTNANNRGPLRVSNIDRRYFEHADGTVFLGNGHGTGYDTYKRSYDAEDQFNTIGTGNQNFFRYWIPGRIWGSGWWSWYGFTGYDGTVPNANLSLDSRYGEALASMQLDDTNWIRFQGWQSANTAIVPGRQYRVRVRWRTDGITGPATAGQPYGVCVRFTGWPQKGQTGTQPLGVAHVNGDTPWHVAEGTITASGSLLNIANGDFLANPALLFENCTGGRAFVDEMTVQEVLAGGALGPNLLRHPHANALGYYEPNNSASLDALLQTANQRGFYYKLNISEKQEWLLNHLSSNGLPDAKGGNFNKNPGTPNERLHEYYWRYMIARYGAYRSVHSWELVNEEAPGPGEHFRLAAHLAQIAAADGNAKMATTSTWATTAESAWNDSASAPISYNDFHCYVRGTGWINPEDDLANDSARFMNEYDLDARGKFSGANTKPIVWGEQGIDGTTGTDGEDPGLASDNGGVWLHKMVWARSGPGGVYPLYWYTDNLFAKNLHAKYGNWNRFMNGVPLNNGRYVDAAGSSPSTNLRLIGQKDLQGGRAHLWIDNKTHTWKRVTTGQAATAVSSTVTVNMQVASAQYDAQWFDTSTGQGTLMQTVTADANGVVTLSVTNLSTDTAVQLTRRSANPASITVTAPNGGESFTTGQTITVAWSSTGSVGNVDIAISANGGSTWTTVMTDTANDGAQTMNLPGATGTQYRVRVQEADGAPSDVSNANFSLTVNAAPAPNVSSPLSFSPTEIVIGQSVIFAIGASDPLGGVLTYAWNFGDGTISNDAAPSHSFASAGVYTVTLTLTTALGGSATQTVTLTVSDPNAGGGVGGGGGGGTAEPLAMTVTKLSGSMKFGVEARDGAAVSGLLPGLPALFDPSNAAVVLNIGGAVQSFVLNSKGSGKNEDGSFALKLKTVKNKATKKKEFTGGDAPFKAKIMKGTWSDDWADEGANAGADAKNAPMTLMVRIEFGANVYVANVAAFYSAKAGKSGKFRK